MKPILVVEDSAMVMKIIKHVLSQSTLIRVDYAASFAQAKQLVESAEQPYYAALVDLSLPDAPSGEVVDYTLSQGIPSIVLTSSFDERKREAMLNKGIVDYVTKEGRYSYELALNTLHRLVKNESTKVLVVDDSSVQRKMLKQLLKLHLFDVYEACDGIEAIKVILANPDIRLLITDYVMPRMDGCELIKNLRIKYEKSDLVIIGLSSEGEGALSAKLIKYGANDFLRKPFNHEEFFCRINHNVEFLELIEKVRDLSDRDDLTGIFNRSYFFRKGADYFASAVHRNTPLAGAIIHIDNYTEIANGYGLDCANNLMKLVAERLVQAFERFLLARGEDQDFYVLFPGLDNDKACAYIERVRQLIGAEPFDLGVMNVDVAFTAGVSNILGGNIDELMLASKQCLSRAIEAGSDIVLGD